MILALGWNSCRITTYPHIVGNCCIQVLLKVIVQRTWKTMGPYRAPVAQSVVSNLTFCPESCMVFPFPMGLPMFSIVSHGSHAFRHSLSHLPSALRPQLKPKKLHGYCILFVWDSSRIGHWTKYLSIYLSIHPSIYLTIYLFVYLYKYNII